MKAFEHKTDIDPDGTFSCQEMDVLLRKTVLRSDECLKHSVAFGPVSTELVRSLIQAFLLTHKSIRELMKTIGDTQSLVSDGMSLVREQVEKVFSVCLLLEEPEKWTNVYLKDAWAKLYRSLLQQQLETVSLPRFDQFRDSLGPQHVELMRQQYSITIEEKEYIEHRFLKPGEQLPSHLVGHKVEHYPMPKHAISLVSSHFEPVLDRWYFEYEQSCAFSHVLFRKLVLIKLEQNHHPDFIAMKTDYANKEVTHGLVLSYLSVAFVATELYGKTNDLALLEVLDDYWSILRRSSLIGEAIWQLRSKDVLPISLTP